jgi:hypothetical protein
VSTKQLVGGDTGGGYLVQSVSMNVMFWFLCTLVYSRISLATQKLYSFPIYRRFVSRWLNIIGVTAIRAVFYNGML